MTILLSGGGVRRVGHTLSCHASPSLQGPWPPRIPEMEIVSVASRGATRAPVAVASRDATRAHVTVASRDATRAPVAVASRGAARTPVTESVTLQYRKHYPR